MRNLNGHIREIGPGFGCLTRTIMTFAADCMQVLHLRFPKMGWALLVNGRVEVRHRASKLAGENLMRAKPLGEWMAASLQA